MIIDFLQEKKLGMMENVIIVNIIYGYKTNNPNIIWCDKHIKYKEKADSCEKYKFRLEEK